MPTTNNLTSNYTLSSGGGTINLPTNEPYNTYRFSGIATLSSSYTIQSSGTPIAGMEYRILYQATLTLGANTLTIFGANIISDLSKQSLEIHAYYNGTSWETKVLADFGDTPFITSDMIESMTLTSSNFANDSVPPNAIQDNAIDSINLVNNSIITTKILDSNVTLAKLETKLKPEVIIVPVSFESGEQSNNSITIPYDFRIDTIRYDITKAIANTDVAIINPFINGVATSPSSITIPLSTVINTTASTTLASSNTGTTNQVVKFVTSKTTPGGKALLTISLTRI